MREGIATTVTEKLDVVFNERARPQSGCHLPRRKSLHAVWASNGDAISLEYAGTSALKGDFVRYVGLRGVPLVSIAV
jgi:hypothetical protein